MAYGYDAMMQPSVEDLLCEVESRFVLVTLAAKRSREIVDYRGQYAASGAVVPPQVEAVGVKPLSVALEEIAAGKIKAAPISSDAYDVYEELDDEGLGSAEEADGDGNEVA